MTSSDVVIRSGGQSGVDRAALEVAVALRLRYAGWCPAGGWAEDYQEPPGIRARYPNLVETPSRDSRQRTAWNVRDSDATLIVTPDADLERSPGTAFARVCAELIFAKPLHVAPPTSEPERAAQWLARHHTQSGLELNVAGPRASEHPEIHALATTYLTEVLRSLLHLS